MKKILSCCVALCILSAVAAKQILVANINELVAANDKAMPGDTITLKNGTWSNCKIELTCNGTALQPIMFMAQKAGSVVITDKSYLRIAGSFIVVNGLNFLNGSAAQGDVWSFKLGKEVGSNCRITNCAINNFNNPKRINENYWVSLFGKNNRIDHCNFYHKNNLGVLMAVVLEDERSRENNHSIDSNYFGIRLPLASNAGEIIRVGVSQHCTFFSRTIIRDNLFEHCDGEAEIISIKSCGNAVRNNIFKECQGSISLRHGNYNTVEGNIFLGNDKLGTGGARIINEGNWVVNNLFYHCRGVDFRSPLAIMNGVFHSPAYRYLPVRDAVVAYNSFVNCTPFSLCEGSDSERTVPPINVYVFNNVFANDKDSVLYHVFDKTDSIFFANNVVSKSIQQHLMQGFNKKAIDMSKLATANFPINSQQAMMPDSLYEKRGTRLAFGLPQSAGFNRWDAFKKAQQNVYVGKGNSWDKTRGFNQGVSSPTSVNCSNATEIYRALETAKTNNVWLTLTGSNYVFTKPIILPTNILILTHQKSVIHFSTSEYLPAIFIVPGGSSVWFVNLNVDVKGVNANSLILTDTAASSKHLSVNLYRMSISGADEKTGLANIFTASRYSVADSISADFCSFSNNNCNLFSMQHELDNKGYYNAEKIRISDCTFSNGKGSLLNIYRGGNDESTMGPDLKFTNNVISNYQHSSALINLYGVQLSLLKGNRFVDANTGNTIIKYQDRVRAAHRLLGNRYERSGVVEKNGFVSGEK